MLNWMAKTAAVIALSLAATPALAQGVAIPFGPGQIALDAETRAGLDELIPEIRRSGGIQITGHADAGEAAAAAEAVAVYRARAIGVLLLEDERNSGVGLHDDYFSPDGDQISANGAALLDDAIARQRQKGGFLVFIHPRYGADALEQRRAHTLARALYDRGGTGIMADGDDFPAGDMVANEALRAEIEAYRRGVTQPVVVVQAFETNPAEGAAALTALAELRARNVRDYLTAGGVAAGLMTVRSAGATVPAGAPDDNRRVELIAAPPSGW